MDTVLKKAMDVISRYRYVVLILIIGVILMLLPTTEKKEKTQLQEPTAEETVDLASELEMVLAQMQGVGKVQVLLTVQTGQTTVYQQDEDDTVIVTDENRIQSGLVEYIESPQYRGAVIVCQGADSAAVRLSIIEAVSNATGLSTDRITVLKMK